MSTTHKSSRALEDIKVPVRLKIASLWIATMFCYVYGDIYVLQQPGHLKQLIDGTVWYGGPITQNMLLAFAISISIPSAMIFLSLSLRPNIARWMNIVLALIFTAFMDLTLFLPDVWYFYFYLGAVETIFTLLIAWYAWKWPREELR